MKAANQIFDESFKNIILMVEKANFQACVKISHDAIITFSMIGYSDGIFIFELLEGIFAQIDDSLDHYVVTDNVVKDLCGRNKDYLLKILSSYNEDNKTRLYNALKDIRTDATMFQSDNFRFGKQKSKNNPFSELGQLLTS
jgi:hypothetical protein